MLPPDVVRLVPAATAPIYATAALAQAITAASLLRYDAAVMDACPQLKLIARTGIGVDNVDLEAATARGIVVTNTPDGPTESTAEHTVAMLLGLAKRIKQGSAHLAEGRWGQRPRRMMGDEVQGKTLGLVGLGRIGRRVAHICGVGLGMRVIGYDPLLTPEQALALGVEPVSLERVIAEADFLSLHAPAIPETYKLMDRGRHRPHETGRLPAQHGARHAGGRGGAAGGARQRAPGGSRARRLRPRAAAGRVAAAHAPHWSWRRRTWHRAPMKAGGAWRRWPSNGC